MNTSQISQISEYTRLISDIDSKIKTLNKRKSRKRNTGRRSSVRHGSSRSNSVELRGFDNIQESACYTRPEDAVHSAKTFKHGFTGAILDDERRYPSKPIAKEPNRSNCPLKDKNEIMVDVRNLKNLIFSMVGDFMDDFRVSFTQELTQLLNFSSENNSSRLHSNLDYFRDELVTWKDKQSKEIKEIEEKVADLESSLTTVLQLFDQRGLLNIFSSKDTFENHQETISVEENFPERPLKSQIPPTNIAQPTFSLKKPREAKKTGEDKNVAHSDNDMCNFSNHHTRTESVVPENIENVSHSTADFCAEGKAARRVQGQNPPKQSQSNRPEAQQEGQCLIDIQQLPDRRVLK